MKLTKKDLTIYIVLWVVVIASIVTGLTLCCKTSVENTVSNKPVNNVVENITFCEDTEINRILQKAMTGINTYNFSLYFDTKVKYNQVFDADTMNQFYKSGGNDSDFQGLFAFAVATTVLENKEFMAIMKQENLPLRKDSASSQTLYDFDTHKSYTQAINLNTKGTPEWQEGTFDESIIAYIDFLTFCDVVDMTSDANNYYIHLTYNYAEDIKNEDKINNIEWVWHYLARVYNLKSIETIPMTATINKQTGMLTKIEYDLNELLNTTFLTMYDIKSVQFSVNLADWNTAEINIPEDLKKAVK